METRVGLGLGGLSLEITVGNGDAIHKREMEMDFEP